jgi:hypothetical protein
MPLSQLGWGICHFNFVIPTGVRDLLSPIMPASPGVSDQSVTATRIQAQAVHQCALRLVRKCIRQPARIFRGARPKDRVFSSALAKLFRKGRAFLCCRG